MFLDVFSDNNVTIVTNDKGYIETYIIYINIYNIKLKLIFSFCHFVIVICHIVTFIIITSKRLASFLDVTKKGESANITCTCKI